MRYLLIPGVGAALAWVVWQRLPARQLERRLAGRADRTAVALALAAGLVGVSLLGLRYATWHTHVFDLGSYDQKIWVASVQEDLTGVIEQTYRGGERFSPCGATRYWGICHFQPLYVIYALAYRLWPSPLLLLWSQALLVASGVIPCYLLTRKLLGSTAGVLGVMVYLLHPAVQFNALLDFRPDHVAIPFLFWAFWLAVRDRPALHLFDDAIPAHRTALQRRRPFLDRVPIHRQRGGAGLRWSPDGPGVPGGAPERRGPPSDGRARDAELCLLVGAGTDAAWPRLLECALGTQ